MTKNLEACQKANELFDVYFRYVLIKKIPIEEKKIGSLYVSTGNEKQAKLSHTNKGMVVKLGRQAFEFESQDKRPKMGDIVSFTRYEDFILDHTKEVLDGEFAIVYDEAIVATERNKESV